MALEFHYIIANEDCALMHSMGLLSLKLASREFGKHM